MQRSYCVYFMASASRTLYVGVTGDLETRVRQHRDGTSKGFSSRYRCHRLVYCETFSDVRYAIDREKQIKRWRRQKKVALIDQHNPQWLDLMPEKLGRDEQAHWCQVPPRVRLQSYVRTTDRRADWVGITVSVTIALT